MTIEQELRELNERYVRAWLTSDTAWYSKHLADDFVCVNPDASAQNKKEFLAEVAGGTDLATYDFELVDIRVFGDVGLIRAIGRWTTHSGTRGTSHYTDIYVRKGQDWRCVSAQICRPNSVPVTAS